MKKIITAPMLVISALVQVACDRDTPQPAKPVIAGGQAARAPSQSSPAVLRPEPVQPPVPPDDVRLSVRGQPAPNLPPAEKERLKSLINQVEQDIQMAVEDYDQDLGNKKKREVLEERLRKADQSEYREAVLELVRDAMKERERSAAQ